MYIFYSFSVCSQTVIHLTGYCKQNKIEKQMKKQLLQSAVLLGCMLLTATFIFAGPPGNGGGSGAPIDGGLSLLIGAGASYGIKKLYKNKAKKEEENR